MTLINFVKEHTELNEIIIFINEKGTIVIGRNDLINDSMYDFLKDREVSHTDDSIIFLKNNN